MHGESHPNVHDKWKSWSNEETLHVAVAYSNPYRWRTRRELLNDFRHHMNGTANVVLHVGELAYGDRPFEVTGNCEHDVQFRTESELFHKENIINEIVKRFPPDWKYGAYIDGDFSFTRHDWAIEAIHKLQHHQFVQLFSSYADISARQYGQSKVTRVNSSFAATYIDGGCKLPDTCNPGGWGMNPYCGKWKPLGATGGAWAFRREAFDTVGGLLEPCILGHGDWFMAFGLVCEKAPDMHDDKYHKNYYGMIDAWQKRAALLKKNIGYVDQFAIHHFHGSKKNRGYSTRDMILARHQFDPINDVRKNWHGIWELTGDKHGFRDDVREYFLSRKEDDPTD